MSKDDENPALRPIKPGDFVNPVIDAVIAGAGIVSGEPWLAVQLSLLKSSLFLPRERFVEYAQKVAGPLRDNEDKVDREYLHTEEYGHMWGSCMNGYVREIRTEKRSAFAGMAVNSSLKTRMKASEREVFLSLVEDLSPVHLLLIAFAHAPLLNESFVNLFEQGNERYMWEYYKNVSEVSHTMLQGVIKDLHSRNLFHEPKWMVKNMKIPPEHVLQNLTTHLAPLGTQLAEFCTLPLDGS